MNVKDLELKLFRHFLNLSFIRFDEYLLFLLQELDLLQQNPSFPFDKPIPIVDHFIDKDHGLLEQAIKHHRPAHLLIPLILNESDYTIVVLRIVIEVYRADRVLASQLFRGLPVVFVSSL